MTRTRSERGRDDFPPPFTLLRAQRVVDTPPPMSQSELARRSGISFVTINGISNNRTAMVSLKTLGHLASTLGVHPGELFAVESRPRRR